MEVTALLLLSMGDNRLVGVLSGRDGMDESVGVRTGAPADGTTMEKADMLDILRMGEWLLVRLGG